jgi:hypothetical protein
MELFDKKIDHFSGRNRRQRQLSLSHNPMTPFLSFISKKLKEKKKNEVWYQNVMYENYRDWLPNSF